MRSAQDLAQRLQPMLLAVKGGLCGFNGSGIDRCAAFSFSTTPKKSSSTDLRHYEQTSVSSAVATGHRRIHKIPSNGISFGFQRGNVMSNRIEKKREKGQKRKKEKRNSSRWGSCQWGTKTKKAPWHRLNTLRDNGGASAGCHFPGQVRLFPTP